MRLEYQCPECHSYIITVKNRDQDDEYLKCEDCGIIGHAVDFEI